MKPDAAAHYEIAQRKFMVQRYREAAEELRTTYELDPRPELLYSLGQALRFDHDCRAAVVAYHSFLTTNPIDKQVASARANIERCEAELAAPTTTPPASVPAHPPMEPPSAATVSTPSPSSAVVARAPRKLDVLGLALTGAGVAVAASGAALLGVSAVRIDATYDASTYDQYRNAVNDAHSAPSLRWAGVGCATVGGALIVAGVVHLGLHHHRARTASVQPVAWARP